jgi:hypothetical protein
MERNGICWWPVVDGLPSPLSTDPEEIAIYMRLAHAVSSARPAAARGRR